MMTVSLTAPEEMFLLSRKNETGTEQGHFVQYALAGCIVSDLMLRELITADPEKPKKLIIVDPVKRTGITYLDDALALFTEKKMSGKSASDFVTKLAGKKPVLTSIGDSLVAKRVLEEDPQSFLGFKWKHFPEADAAPEQALVSRLSKVMFQDVSPTAEDCVLIALMKATTLLEKNFDKTQLKAHKQRVKDLANAETELTRGTTKAIDAVRTAVIVAAIMPAIVASSS